MGKILGFGGAVFGLRNDMIDVKCSFLSFLGETAIVAMIQGPNANES
jgi:hypothetical protein